MKITISERPYFGHGTVAQHVYNINESLNNIKYDKLNHELVVNFTTCATKMKIHVDELTEIKIEGGY